MSEKIQIVEGRGSDARARPAESEARSFSDQAIDRRRVLGYNIIKLERDFSENHLAARSGHIQTATEGVHMSEKIIPSQRQLEFID